MTTATVAGHPARPPGMADTNRPANRRAEQITGRTYLSYSQMSLMRTRPSPEYRAARTALEAVSGLINKHG
ncbi:MAG: hypothetical protein ABSH20_08690, partial [Tepidisphaeraceae bacterium]